MALKAVKRTIVGCDRDAGIVHDEFRIPDLFWHEVLSLVEAKDHDPGHLTSYELSTSQADRILKLIGKMRYNALIYYLECERG